MGIRILQVFVCAALLISIQGCLSFHSTSVRDNPPTQTTTVYPVPSGDAVAVTTGH